MINYKSILLVLFSMMLSFGCSGSSGTELVVDDAGDDAGVNLVDLVSSKCDNGGEVLELEGSLIVVCHGEDGEDGSSVTLSVESADEDDCPNGGSVVSVTDSSGKVHTALVCNGSDGANGSNGVDGEDGNDGEDGTNGVDGEDGSDGENGANGADGVDGSDGVSVEVTLLEATESECPNGGTLVVVESAEGMDTIPVCNGEDGTDGEAAKVNVVAATTDQCPNGGYVVLINDESLLLCNGVDGSTGTRGSRGFVGDDGESVLLTPVPEGVEECNGLGGVRLTVGDETQLVCNGVPGDSAIVEVVEASNEQCPAGGFVFSSGVETYVGYRTEMVDAGVDAGVDGGMVEQQLPLTETVMNEDVVMCNGVDGDSVTVSTRPAFWECPGWDIFDGTVITLSEIDGLTDQEVDSETVIVCDGEDGITPQVSVRPAYHHECVAGGAVITVNNNSRKVCNGVSCSVSDVEGGAEITCGDDTVFVSDGENGEDGTDCHITRTPYGAFVWCGWEWSNLYDGVDGDDCSVVASNDDDCVGAEVTCGDETVCVENGEDGQSCTVTDHPDGALVTCGDTLQIIEDGSVVTYQKTNATTTQCPPNGDGDVIRFSIDGQLQDPVVICDDDNGVPCELNYETRVLTCGEDSIVLPEETVNDCPGEWRHFGFSYQCIGW